MKQQLPNDPYLCTVETVRNMKQLAVQGSHDPRIVELSRAVVRHLKNKDYVGELRAIFDFVKENVRYVRDPLGMETLATPHHVALVTGHGDCDEHATLIAAMALSTGHRAGFRCVKSKGSPTFTHVYALVSPGRKNDWYAADTTEKRSYFGWDPADVLGLEAQDWFIT